MSLNPNAATWRDPGGRIVATVYGRTECRAPLNTRDLAARTDDGNFETILRCRKCEGCRQYEYLELRRRLAAHYKEVSDDIWIVTIQSPLEEHSRLAGRVRRSRACTFEPGLYRVSDSAFALVARGVRPALERIRALRTRTFGIQPIGKSRDNRAFRSLARACLVGRDVMGQWANRFYQRGLKPGIRETFVRETRGGIRKRHSESRAGFRAWRGGLTLYASPIGAGAEAVALLLKRDGHLNGRKCTHKSCTADRCKYGKPPSGRDSTINQRPRASAVSVSSMPGTGVASASSLPRPTVTTVTGGRDAGSSQVKNAQWRATLDRFAKLGQPKPPDRGGGGAES